MLQSLSGTVAHNAHKPNTRIMKRIIFIATLLMAFFSATAHQTEVSSTILIEQSPDRWLLQVKSALSAFDYEITHTYGKDSYNTPEEFKELVLEQLTQHISVNVNDGEFITLTNGQVKLGHETNVVFQLAEVPSNIETLKISNTAFDDIYRNQSAFLLVKQGYPKQQYMLNSDNQHQVSLDLTGDVVVQLGQVEVQGLLRYYILALTLGLLIIAGIWKGSQIRQGINL